MVNFVFLVVGILLLGVSFYSCSKCPYSSKPLCNLCNMVPHSGADDEKFAWLHFFTLWPGFFFIFFSIFL